MLVGRMLQWLLIGVIVSGCAAETRSRAGISSGETAGYTVLYTPTHRFECSYTVPIVGKFTEEFLPGAIFGATDFSGMRYQVDLNIDQGQFEGHVIGLQLSTVNGRNGGFALIHPDGQFAVPNYPVGIYHGHFVVLPGNQPIECTNDTSLPPFKQL